VYISKIGIRDGNVVLNLTFVFSFSFLRFPHSVLFSSVFFVPFCLMRLLLILQSARQQFGGTF